MPKPFILLFVLLSSVSLMAQDKAMNQKLEKWNTYCDQLKGIPSGKEDYPRLIIAARKGLQMTPSGNFYYKSLFAFHLAGGFESTYKIDSAIHYYEQSLDAAKKISNNSRIVFALRRVTTLYDTRGRKEKGDAARQQLIGIAKKDKDPEIQMGVSIVLGEHYFNSGQFEEALRRYLDYIKYVKADYIRTKSSDSKANTGVALLAIGEIYQNLNRYGESLDYFIESLPYLDGYREGLEVSYKDLVTSFLELKKTDSALRYYQKLKNSVLKSNDYTVLSDAQTELANHYLQRNELKSAELMLHEAAISTGISQEKEDLGNLKIVEGDLALKRGQFRKAIDAYQAALPLVVYYKNKGKITHLYYNLSLAQKALGLLDEAFVSVSNYAKYQDSLKTESVSKNIAEMEARFQNEVKQQKIELLARDNQLVRINLQQERRVRWLLAGAVVLSLLTAAMIYKNFVNNKKANLLLARKNDELDQLNRALSTANQTKAKLFSIIAHDLRSPINQVYQFLKLQQLNPNLLDEGQKEKLSGKIQGATSSLLETMEDLLLWSKTQLHEFKTEMQEIELLPVVVQTEKLLELNYENKGQRLSNSIPEGVKVVTDPYFFQIILRNLLQNAVKAAPEQSEISISYLSIPRKAIVIHNEGPVFTEEQYQTIIHAEARDQVGLSGLGLRLVDELSAKIGARIRFNSRSAEGGTEVIIEF